MENPNITRIYEELERQRLSGIYTFSPQQAAEAYERDLALSTKIDEPTALREIVEEINSVDNNGAAPTRNQLDSRGKAKPLMASNSYLRRYVDHFDIYAPVFGAMIICLFIVVFMLRQSIPTSTMFNQKHAKKETERSESQKIAVLGTRRQRLLVFLKNNLKKLFGN